jgi:hypothetical protein
MGCLSYCCRRKLEESDLTQPLAPDQHHESYHDNEIKNFSSNKTRDVFPKAEEPIISLRDIVDVEGPGLGFGTFQPLRSPLLDVPDEQLSDLQKLEKHCPAATEAERQRFLNAKGGKYKLAYEQLKQYLEWREEYELDHIIASPPLPSEDEDFQSCASSDLTLDEMDWRFASDKALSYDPGHVDSLPIMLPQLARILTIPGSDEHLRDRSGDRILHLLPAQMDPHIAADSTFALCIAFYLERKLGRNSMEQMVVVIDVRGGHGWANPKPGKLIPFIKKVTSITERNFPERLSRSLLFPMPRTAAVLWKMIKMFLDPNTAEKIVVVAGKANNDSPPPYKKMEAYVGREVIDRMEALRCASFTEY